MMLRTPPRRKRRLPDGDVDLAADAEIAAEGDPVSDRRLVVYGAEAGAELSSDLFSTSAAARPAGETMACTYHCRQMVKSEFINAFQTAEKQVAEYQAKLQNLERQLNVSENERMNYKDRINFLEQELAATKGRECTLEERLLKEVADNQEKFCLQLMQINQLELQLKEENASRITSESSATVAKDEIANLERELQQSSGKSKREINALKRELSYLRDDSKVSASKMSAELERTRIRAESAEGEAELLNQKLNGLKEQMDECLQQKNRLEHELASSAVLVNQGSTHEDQQLIKLLREELRSCECEVQEARRMKSVYVSNELLKEQLLEEKGHRERAEMELSNLQEIRFAAQKLEHELASWKALLKEIPGVSCRDDILQKFAALQKEAVDSMKKVGEATSRLKELEVAVEFANLRREQAETEAILAKKKADSANLEVKRLELMLDRIRNGRLTPTKEKSECSDETLLKDLEGALDDKENIIKELEGSLHEQKELIMRQHDELKMINEKLISEARKVKSLEREGDCLRAGIALLESKLGHGDYSATNTKVLRMANTLGLEHEAKQTIEALQTELKKAQEKLQAVEELKGNADTNVTEKLTQLKEQIAVLEKREERYKAVFAEKITVFRKACCSLFGYKIVMDDQRRPNGILVTKFVLQSVYAQGDDENLEFEYESGSTNIMVNDYTSQPEIAQQVDIFIRRMNSIPAFTANLTIESFNKRTLS